MSPDDVKLASIPQDSEPATSGSSDPRAPDKTNERRIPKRSRFQPGKTYIIRPGALDDEWLPPASDDNWITLIDGMARVYWKCEYLAGMPLFRNVVSDNHSGHNQGNTSTIPREECGILMKSSQHLCYVWVPEKEKPERLMILRDFLVSEDSFWEFIEA